jgi:hypothetical protein
LTNRNQNIRIFKTFAAMLSYFAVIHKRKLETKTGSFLKKLIHKNNVGVQNKKRLSNDSLLNVYLTNAITSISI